MVGSGAFRRPGIGGRIIGRSPNNPATIRRSI
jgi:hypothetical protein